MKLLGVVVLFNPDENVWANIATYINGVDELILWCNSSIPIIPILSDKVIVMGSGNNVGIGKALNETVLYAIQNGYYELNWCNFDDKYNIKSLNLEQFLSGTA